jgi:hypothetical protein
MPARSPSSLTVLAQINLAGHLVAIDGAREFVRQTLSLDPLRTVEANLICRYFAVEVARYRLTAMRAN